MTKREIPASDGVEVYVGANGHVIIKQISSYGDEAVIALDPHRVPQLIEYLEETRQEAMEFTPETEVTE